MGRNMSQTMTNRTGTIEAKAKIMTFSFCESFKDRLVAYIRKEYADQGRDLSRLAIVFGGKRPALFIKRGLARSFGRSFYPPRFFTVDEFMEYTVRKQEPYTRIQDLDNCYLLYKLAKELTPHILKERPTFAKFLPWTREILKFIDNLDLEMIDDRELKNIQANAEIGYDVPKDVNTMLEGIVALRSAYHKKLQTAKAISRGLQYLKAAHLADKEAFDEFDQILFCNFFYFHRTEERLVKALHKRGKATLIFQGDQRKWPVLERISGMFDAPIVEGEKPDTPRFDLKLHAAFDVHSEVAMARAVLEKTKAKDKTVIVLPDPDHVIPLLSEASKRITDYNVSMGYPLKRSSLYTLFEFVFKAQLSKRGGQYYARDYLKAMRHPFVKNLKGAADAAATRVLAHKIEEILTGKVKAPLSGSLFIDPGDVEALNDLYSSVILTLKRMKVDATRKDLRSHLKTIHGLLFGQWEDINDFHGLAGALRSFLDEFVQKSFLKNYPINLNIATKVYAVIEEFEGAAFANEAFDKEELFRVFEEKMGHERIRFEGSPLKGLQILGLQETRSLDFDHVIVLDVNEGVLPSLRIHEPLIPREVMISLGLNRLELEEEIQRYQFMRLISSAKTVNLIYQEGKDKERSRFVEELIWEEQKRSGTLAGLAVTEPRFRVEAAQDKRVAHKTPAMIEALKRHTYSASSINMYLRDPMEFYTNYVLGLREHEDMLDEPDARHVGTFMHDLLEEAFMPYLGKEPKINRAFEDRFNRLFEHKFEETFARSMRSDAFLLRSVLNERLKRFVQNEREAGDRRVKEVLYLEERFEGVIALPAGQVKFGYVVDRVDRMKDGTVMIIDYKSGNADLMPKPYGQIAAMDLSREAVRDCVKSFQIPLYFHYLDRQFPKEQVNAALYSLKTMKLNTFCDWSKPVDRNGVNAAFLRALNFIMEEIFNPGVPFVEDPDGTFD